MRSWQTVRDHLLRAYRLDDWHPQEVFAVAFGTVPAYCHRCEQLSAGGGWEPQTREFLCGSCYERSEYAHRVFKC
jgi:hypothetical protein